MSAVKPGSIILMHDGCGDMTQTVSASKIIIKQLKDLGYKFVTVSELLAYKDQAISELKNTEEELILDTALLQAQAIR